MKKFLILVSFLVCAVGALAEQAPGKRFGWVGLDNATGTTYSLMNAAWYAAVPRTDTADTVTAQWAFTQDILTSKSAGTYWRLYNHAQTQALELPNNGDPLGSKSAKFRLGDASTTGTLEFEGGARWLKWRDAYSQFQLYGPVSIVGAIQVNGTELSDISRNLSAGTITGTGNINSSTGAIQTAGVTRIANSGAGTFTSVGATGAFTGSSTGSFANTLTASKGVSGTTATLTGNVTTNGNLQSDGNTILGSATGDTVTVNGTVQTSIPVVDNLWMGLGAAAGRIEFDDQTVDEFNILNANVGIGTATPTTADASSRIFQVGTMLLLQDVVGAQGMLAFNAHYDGAWKRVAANEAAGIRFGAAGASYYGDISFHIAATGNAASTITNWDTTDQRMIIKNTGNVGIGDISPASMFTVGSGDLFQVNSSGAIVAAVGITQTGKTINTPTAKNITAASDTIPITPTDVKLTSVGAQTLTSAPTIAAGTDGQILIIYNVDVDGDTVTIQDRGTLANSNLWLTTTTFVCGKGDSITLKYSSDLAGWIEIARSNVL